MYRFERVEACEARLEELVKWAEDRNKFIMGKYGAVCGKVGRKEEESFWSSMRKMSRGVLAQLEEMKLSITSVVECFPDLKTLEEKFAIKSRQHDKKKGEKRKATTQLKFGRVEKGSQKANTTSPAFPTGHFSPQT